MSKLMSALALGCIVFGLSTSASTAGSVNGLVSTLNGVVYEQQECPDGEQWNEEKQACEKVAAE